MSDNEEIVQDDEFSPDELIIRKKKTPELRTGVTAESVLKTTADALETLRAKNPLIECLTSLAGATQAANALFAAGASPMVVEDMGEATQLARTADGLLVNMGTVTKPQTDAMRAAVSHANSAARPWVLVPSGIGALPLRTFATKELMRRFPAVIRGNGSEIMFLAGAPTGGRGSESLIPSEDAVQGAQRLAGVTHATVLVAGETDYVAAEGAPVVAVSNGSPMMARVAGIGTVQGLFGAAFLGTLGSKARWEATLATALVTAIAGELAAAKTSAPGSYQIAFLDALAAIKPEDVVKRGRVKLIEQAS